MTAATNNEVKTITLRNGREVTAKDYKGELSAITYINRTQAQNASDKLGAGWEVYKGIGRPFYVTRSN